MAQTSKKLYKAVAEKAAEHRARIKQHEGVTAALASQADFLRDLAAIFEADNPRFNAARFFQACGIAEEWTERPDK